MKHKIIGLILMLFICVGMMSGCGIKTVDELYCLPKRSEDYHELQSAIDGVMNGLEYSAPIQGENQQTIQLADLTGDGLPEAVLFAKGNDQNPLKVFIFSKVDGLYRNVAKMEFPGTAFEQVEYGDINGKNGQELVIGRQMGNEVLHALSVYSLADGTLETILTAGYTRFLTLDLAGDGTKDVFILRPGTEAGNGVAELYRCKDGSMERAAEAPMSVPVDSMRRIAPGGMYGNMQAVFVASAYDENTIITDVYAMVNQKFTNVSLSSESGTSIKTIRNYHVYADDIDGDGLIELPALVHQDKHHEGISQDFIRWYNLSPGGQEVEKVFTYHNYSERWYVSLEEKWMNNIQVTRGNDRGGVSGYVFTLDGAELFTIYAYAGADRAAEAQADGGFVLKETGEIVYGAVLGECAEAQGLTKEKLMEDFQFIQDDWKTGET